MTAKDLKNALLQEAVQGKLVSQIASEGNAKDLLEEIRKEKAKLVKEGKLKKEKPLPEITEEDIPFDIHENWCWCRLGDFCDVVTGSLDANAQDENGKYAFFTCGVEVYKTKQYAFDCDAILLGGNNASGDYKMHRYKGKFNAYQRVYVISGANTITLDYFEIVIKYWLPHLKKNSQGTTTRFIKLSQVNGMYIPLPPLAEQKRIVSAIERFMPLIEEYGKKETELKAFNGQIGALAKKAILQEAVQGKLVPQIAADGNAKDLLEEIKKEKAKLIKEGKLKKEKPLPEITEEDVPFDIPENWCWCRFGDIFQHNTGKTQNSSVETKNGKLRKFITTSNLYWNEFDFTKVKEMLFSENELQRCTVTKGDLLICEGGEYGRSAIWKYDYDVCFQNHIHRARAIKENTIYVEFYYFLIFLYKNIGFIEGRGVGIKSLSTENLHQIIFPLPPLAEQRRIVAAIEKLLPLCEKLGV